MRTEAEYLLRRASEEAQRAISADEPAVADAHEELSVRYSARAVTLIVEDADKSLSGDDERQEGGRRGADARSNRS